MVPFLESCSTSEICASMNVSEQLLADLQDKLRDWLVMQPHLPQDVSERRLEHFIISAKLSLELAKQKLDMYYTVRHLVPELFTNRDPLGPNVTRLNENCQWISLPKLTPEKYRVSIMRAINEDATTFEPWDLFKYSFMIGDVRMEECRSLGCIYVYDLAETKISHIAKLTPVLLKKCEIVAMRAYGTKIKGIHFINAQPFIDRVVSLVKSAIKPKIAARIHVHTGGYESLYEFIPKSVLPSDYGGEELSINELQDLWNKKLLAWRDWFLKEEKVIADESLRPESAAITDDLFGIHGSFRKLEVD